MNTPKMLSFVMLLTIVIALPVYGFSESRRMTYNQEKMREAYIQNAIDLYLTNCSRCHGQAGEGVGIMPALNRPALADAQFDMLLRTIGRASHGTTMAAWHVEEGGILTDYQLNEITTLIKYGDWAEVGRVAAARKHSEPPNPAIDTSLEFTWTEMTLDPHQCVECHEEPGLHADAFGINCARCHNTISWVPAVLTRHNFELAHGENVDVTCETCHPTSYARYDCYTCHADHTIAGIQSSHAKERIFDVNNCATCHPTGAAGEAGRLRDLQQNGLTTSESQNTQVIYPIQP